MRKLLRRLKYFMCYILIFSMILPSVGPMSNVKAASSTGLNMKKATILVGEKITLSLEGETISQITSKNKRVAAVKKDGTVTGKKPGTTKVTVTDSKGKQYKCTVKVKVGLAKSTLYLTNKKSATVNLMGAKVKSVKSKNKKIATVKKKSDSVVITAKSPGTVKIKVKGRNKKTYTCKVTVENPTLSNEKLLLAKGDSVSLKLKDTQQKVKWQSAKTKTAEVSEKGVVKAISAGEATVYAVDESNKKYECRVTVEEPKLAATKMYLNVDQSVKLSLTGNTQKITWSSTKSNVASVDSTGKVTAISNGTTVIKAVVESGASFECSVTVTDKENTVSGKSDGKNDSDKKDNGDGDNSEKGSDESRSNDKEVAPGDGDHENNGIDPKKEDSSEEGGSGEEGSSEEGSSEEGGKAEGDPAGTGDKEDVPQETEKKCYVNFVGGDMEPIEVEVGTKISELPIPDYDEDKQIFIGWFYDEEFNEPAKGDDVIDSIVILYAKFEEIESKTLDDAVRITAANDVSTDFKVVLNSKDSGLTASQVYDQISVKNVTETDTDAYLLKSNNISVTGSNGVYTVTGKHLFMDKVTDGFEAGASYKIILPEAEEGSEAVLTFADNPDSVREFDISVAHKEQNNMALANDVVMIPVNKLDGLYDDSGAKLNYIDGSFYTIDTSGNRIENENYSGYFIWSEAAGKDIKVGTTIALYTGMEPAAALKDPEGFGKDENNHIAYLSVTRIDGDKYYFGNAAIEDVIKLPEILPIPATADIDKDDKNNTLEIPLSYLDWSDDVYSQVKLDSQTELEVGDYIIQYSGSFGTDDMKQVGGYQEIIDIKDGGTYTDYLGDEQPYVVVNVKDTTLEAIADSSESYYSNDVDIMDYLTDEDVKELEEEIAEDALNSGFVKEAGLFLAKAAVATDEFKSFEGVEDIETYNFTVNDYNDNVVGKSFDFYNKYKGYNDKYNEMMDSYKQFATDDDDDDGNVEISLENLEVDLAKAEKLTGGVAAHINVGFSIEVKFKPLGSGDDDKKEEDKDGGDSDKDSSDKDKDKDSGDKDKDKDSGDNDKDGEKKEDESEDAEEENSIKIEVSADFIQELQLESGFGASVEWKEVLGFLPVPVDVVFKPSFTTGTYTAIDINALVYTGGKSDGMGSVFEDASEVYSDIGEELKALMEQDEDEDEEESEDIANWLSLRYSQMLETDHEPISLVEKKLTEVMIDIVPIPGILQFGVEVRLCITVDVVATLGVEFTNIQSKKTIYTIHVIKGKCSCDTIELIPAELDFKFYVMGDMELKVGFEIELSLNLLEGVLGKVSLTIGLGPYVDLRGFFYYHVHILKGVKTTNYAGALYVELGIYLEVGLGAQVGKNYKKIKGKIAEWGTTLYENKWPIKKFGKNEVPFNFETRQEDFSDVEMHQYVTKYVVPDEYYSVNTLALDEGTIDGKVYGNECYDFKFSNDNFEYDRNSHTISLKTGYSEQEAECDATMTFNSGRIPLSTAKMTRKFHISWDNYLNGYAIIPFTEGGTYVPASIGAFGSEVKAPKAPTRIGYVFDGWYTENGEKFEYPETMPDKNINIYAHWKPATDTKYTVYYYLEDENAAGSYICDGKNRYKGTTGETVVTEPKEYSGYVTPAAESVEILSDGSAAVRYYYDIIRSTTTFTNGGKGSMGTVKYVTRINDNVYAPDIAAAGYVFDGWKNTSTGDVITLDELVNKDSKEDVGVIRKADGTDVTYEAQWSERNDIGYRVEYYVQQENGAYTVQAIDYKQGVPGTVLNEDDLRNATVETTVKDINALTGKVTENIVKGKADELFTKKDGDADVLTFDSITVGGQPISESKPAKILGDGSLVIKVKYARKLCKVTLDVRGIDGNSLYSEPFNIYYGGKMALPLPEETGYTFKGYKDDKDNTVEINSATGTSIITVTGDATYTSLGWDAISYTVKYDTDGGNMTEPVTQNFVYGTAQKLNKAPEKEGYAFGGWKDESSNTVYDGEEEVNNLTVKPNDTITLKAQWVLKQYTVTYDADGGIIAEGSNPDYYSDFTDDVVLAHPEKEGYTFDGWYDGDDKVVTIPGGKKEDLNLKAHWTAKSDTAYVVNHYAQDVDGKGKTLLLQESLKGTTAASVTPEVKTYEGFVSPEAQTVTIAADGTTVVEYVYNRNQYTVTLKFNDGVTTDKEERLVFGADITSDTFEVPERAGYVFAGWMAGDSDKAATTVPAGDITLKASWISEGEASVTINHYQMDVDGADYTLISSEIRTGAGGDVITPAAENYEGFTLKQPESETVTLEAGKALTYNLYYDRKKVNVEWNLDGGKADGDYTSGATYYGKAIVAPVPVKEYYTYTWNSTPAATAGLEDLSYKAVWTPDTCIVSFDAMGGSVSEIEKTVTFGEKYGELPVPTNTNEDAKFLGWYDAAENGKKVDSDSDVATGKDHILYAMWEYNGMAINYEGLEDADNTANPTKYIIGEKTIIKAPVRAGYTFLGWTDGSGGEPAETYTIGTDSREEVTLTANWQINTYTLQLYGYSGLYFTKEYEFSEELGDITMPVYTGYKLTGWKNEKGESYEIPETMPATNLVLRSQWEPDVYKLVIGNLRENDEVIEEVTWKLGDADITLAPPTKNRTGYDFGGWYASETFDEDKVITKITPVATNITVYAKWIAKTYTAQFIYNEGTGSKVESYSEPNRVYGTAWNIKTAEKLGLTRNGYEFAGWSTSSDAKEVVFADGGTVSESSALGSISDGIINFYAVWTPVTYTITYTDVTAGASENNSKNPATYSIEDINVALRAPKGIKDGYQFLGWYENGNKVLTINADGKETGNRTLEAKWASPGTFSVAISKSSGSMAGKETDKTTFAITRTMPANITVSDDPQRVYYRTVNGTAVGGTADPINFMHVGGENTYALFSDTECYNMQDNTRNPSGVTVDGNTGNASVTFDVKYENVSARYFGETQSTNDGDGVYAQLFNISGTPDRFYTAEIYRIDSTKGDVTGILDDSKKNVRRSMAMPGTKVVTKDTLYKLKKTYNTQDTRLEVDSTTKTLTLDTGLYDDKDVLYYLINTGATAKMRVKVKILEAKFLNEERVYLQLLKYSLGSLDIVYFNSTSQVMYISKNSTVTTDWTDVFDMALTKDDLTFTVGTCNNTSGTFGNHIIELEVIPDYDRDPNQVGIAPAATTNYKAGDTVRFSVIYDELIASTTGLTVNTDLAAIKNYMPVKDVKYVEGVGTNVLVFEGTATKDFKNTTWGGSGSEASGTNKELINVTPVTGTVKNMNSN